MPRCRHPSPTRRLRHFFNVWDVVEQMHPWGVERLQPMLADFDLPAALCAEIDSRLFFDLMIARQPDVQRVRVEGRHSGVVFASDTPDSRIAVAFQRTPAQAFDCRTEVAASPRAPSRGADGRGEAVVYEGGGEWAGGDGWWLGQQSRRRQMAGRPVPAQEGPRPHPEGTGPGLCPPPPATSCACVLM
jgi:hypothetical protein